MGPSTTAGSKKHALLTDSLRRDSGARGGGETRRRMHRGKKREDGEEAGRVNFSRRDWTRRGSPGPSQLLLACPPPRDIVVSYFPAAGWTTAARSFVSGFAICSAPSSPRPGQKRAVSDVLTSALWRIAEYRVDRNARGKNAGRPLRKSVFTAALSRARDDGGGRGVVEAGEENATGNC